MESINVKLGRKTKSRNTDKIRFLRCAKFYAVLHRNRPVYQIKIQIIRLKIFQRFLAGFSDASFLMAMIPHFGRDEDVFPFLAAFCVPLCQRFANLLLVLIQRSAIDKTVANIESGANHVLSVC